jgi:hypothetical protein
MIVGGSEPKHELKWEALRLADDQSVALKEMNVRAIGGKLMAKADKVKSNARATNIRIMMVEI